MDGLSKPSWHVSRVNANLVPPVPTILLFYNLPYLRSISGLGAGLVNSFNLHLLVLGILSHICPLQAHIHVSHPSLTASVNSSCHTLTYVFSFNAFVLCFILCVLEKTTALIQWVWIILFEVLVDLIKCIRQTRAGWITPVMDSTYVTNKSVRHETWAL